jgi:Winged helix DNA-binding domain
MTDDGLDPVIHSPARLRLMVTLATLGDGDTLSFTRLQDMIGLTPGNLITHLRKLEDAGYVQTQKTGSGVNGLTWCPSPRPAGPRWTATPPCCGSCSTRRSRRSRGELAARWTGG